VKNDQAYQILLFVPLSKIKGWIVEKCLATTSSSTTTAAVTTTNEKNTKNDRQCDQRLTTTTTSSSLIARTNQIKAMYINIKLILSTRTLSSHLATPTKTPNTNNVNGRHLTPVKFIRCQWAFTKKC